LAIAARIARPSAGVPSASNTTTPAPVTTNPAFDMNPLFSLAAIPAWPSKNQQCSETCRGVSAISSAAEAAEGASAATTTTATAIRPAMAQRSADRFMDRL
jgi:hypothetical protein